MYYSLSDFPSDFSSFSSISSICGNADATSAKSFSVSYCAIPIGWVMPRSENSAFLLLLVRQRSKANGRFVFWGFHNVINCRNIEVQFANELWFELHGFQFHYNIAMQFEMVHQQVDIIIIPIYGNMVLSAYVCKTTSHLEEKICYLACQGLFYIQFILQCHRSNEREIVRVFEYVTSQV